VADNEIQISLDAAAVDDSASKTARQIAEIVTAGDKAQTSLKRVGKEVTDLGSALRNITDSKGLKALGQINQALAGNFSEAQLKISAVKGTLKELQAQAVNTISTITNAQTKMFADMAKAIKERQVQAFQKSGSLPIGLDQDPNSLKQRIEAQNRAINSAKITGAEPAAAETAQLKALEAQLAKVTAAREFDLKVQKEGIAAYRLTPQVAGPSQPLGQSPQAQQQRAQQSNQQTLAKFGLNGGADFVKVQGTILANYALMGAAFSTLKNSFDFVVGYQSALKQLQAIVGATDSEVAGLSQRFVEVSNNSKFSATEIASAATIMGQAGLSSQDIEASIADVVKLATATGTTLKTAVDLSTTAMNVWNLRVQEMGSFSNVVSAALNESKLDADKLSTALTYVGNTAADAGVSFNEVATALSVASNAGIKSGSTLGTGLRQIIEALINPSQKFKTTLDALGLTLSDVDIHSQGLFGSLRNLSDAGFSVADAFQDFGVRGGGAVAAFINQAGNLSNFQHVLETSGDAAKAQAIQMDSVASQAKRVTSAAGALAVSMSGPLLTALKDTLSVFADFVSGLQGISGVLGVAATALAGAATIMVTKWVTGLAAGLLGVKNLWAGMQLLVEGFAVATTATEVFGVALSVLGKSNLILLGLTAAVTAAITVWEVFGNSTGKLDAQMDKLQTSFDETAGRVHDYQQGITSIGTEIDNLTNRHDRLANHSDELANVIEALNTQFKNMGFYVDANSTSIDELITKMGNLRKAQLDEMAVANSQQQSILKDQIDLSQRKTNTLFGSNGANHFLGQAGVFGTINDLQAHGLGNDPATKAIQGTADLFTGPAPQTDPEISAFNAQVAAKSKELTDLQEKLRASLGDASTEARSEISATIKALNDAATIVNQKTGLEGKLSLTTGQGNADHAAASSVGLGLESLKDDTSKALSGYESAYTGAGGNANEAAKRQHAANLEKLYQDATNQYAAVLSYVDTNTLNDLKQAGVIGDVDKALADLKQRGITAGLDVNKLNQIKLEGEKKVVQATIDRLNSQLNNKSSYSTLEAIPGGLDTAYTKLQSLTVQENSVKQKRTSLQPQGDSSTIGDQEDINALKEKQSQNIDRAKAFMDDLNQSTKEAADKLGSDLPGQFKKFTAGIKAMTESFKIANDNIQQPVKQQQALIASMNTSANKNRYSDVQRQQEQEKLDTLKEQAARQQLAEYQAEVLETQAKIDASKASADTYQKQMDDLQKQIDTKDQLGLTPNAVKGLQSKQGTDKTQRDDYLQQVANLEKQITDLKQKQKDIGDIITAQYETQVQPLSIIDGFQQSWKQYADANLTVDAMNKSTIDSFKGMFSSIQNGMSTFITDMVSGNKTVGQSFQALATSILQSMLKIESDNLAKQIMGAAGSGGTGLLGLLGLGGSSLTGTGAGAGVDGFGALGLGNAGYRSGGPIRMAGGGGVPTRDSVNILGMPGEYMVQKSAVDAVGMDYMNRLNSIAGPRRPTNTPANMNQQPPQQQLVNVYVVSPDQVPPPSPRDIVAHVATDLAQGGVTKRLVKQIANGG
jgi:TP901 family phage tail tape measure protein